MTPEERRQAARTAWVEALETIAQEAATMRDAAHADTASHGDIRSTLAFIGQLAAEALEAK